MSHLERLRLGTIPEARAANRSRPTGRFGFRLLGREELLNDLVCTFACATSLVSRHVGRDPSLGLR